MNRNIIKGISVGRGTVFVASNFYTINLLSKKPNCLKFITHEGDKVEITGAEGLNYRIEQI